MRAGQPKPRGSRHEGGFTLLEVVIVLVVLGILTAVAAPLLTNADGVRSLAAAHEVERTLVVARSHAMATGEAAGVRIDPAASRLELRRLTEADGGPSPMRSVLGVDVEPLVIPARFPGAAIVSVVHGDGSGGTGTVWFAHNGDPELRAEHGDLVGVFTQDAVVSISTGIDVVVRRWSGVVEVAP